MNYNLIRPFLFSLDPEFSHNFTLKAIKLLKQFHLLKLFINSNNESPKEVFGLTFRNPVGLAAGLDKNGDYIDALAALGFGFLEIGTVTPRPQIGNPKPRMFRLIEQQAIINRMGFNNKGVDYLISRVKKKKYNGILGINIGKNADTPIENAIDDYRICLNKVYPYASYVTINISSPNTAGLRSLQSAEYLNELLKNLKQEQAELAHKFDKHVPMLVKISPDITDEEIIYMAKVFLENKVDGIIVTNTTTDREQIKGNRLAQEAGGLSGQPLFDKATHVLNQMKRATLDGNLPIIASGGILSGAQAKAKCDAGASLLQLYTGLIFRGPELITACCLATKY